MSRSQFFSSFPAFLLLLAILLAPTPARGDAHILTPTAMVAVDATSPGQPVSADLWGTNLTQQADASRTVESPTFVTATRQIGVTLIRWPGGNNADGYDWKRNEDIRPGRRVQRPNSVDLSRILRFVQETGTRLSITVNFGTMSPQDAADLVEFLNGPADSTWGARRAAMGFPEPLGVRYFEVGNEIGQPHMWYYAWTAEDPVKYFFGGEEERRGFYENAGSQGYDPVGAKGDFFKATGGPNQRYVLRFPPVREVRVFGFVDQAAAQSCVQTYRQTGTLPTVPNRCEAWKEVADLSLQPANARVFVLDADRGEIRFGDGVHGAMPPVGSYFLVEYVTYGHGGFLDFARAMRGAPSNVPIQIGAAMLPFADAQPITDTARMAEIFAQMDFYVRHQYDAVFVGQAGAVGQSSGRAVKGVSSRAVTKSNGRAVAQVGSMGGQPDGDANLLPLRQIPADRVDHLAAVYGRVREYMEMMGISARLGIGVTEWNVFLNQQYWQINRTQMGAVVTAEWFARLLNAGDTVPVFYANQFALGGGNLALIRSQTNYSLAPMAYVFQGFREWPGSRVLPARVESPVAPAYDRDVPYVTAAAALTADSHTLYLVLVNNAITETITTTVQITGFAAAHVQLWQVAADAPLANNDVNPTTVVPRETELATWPDVLALPPHSVTFLTARRERWRFHVPWVAR